MARRTDFRPATTYTGQKIKGTVEISYKIDAVTFLRFRDDKDTESFDTKGQMK